jgi:hypothetical protein
MKQKLFVKPIFLILSVSMLIFNSCSKNEVEGTKILSHNNENITTLTSGLIAWYTFNGDVLDHSGEGNNITFNSALPAAGKDGIANTAYSFDGFSSYMTAPNSTSLQGDLSKGLTIAVVIKINGFYAGPCHGNRILQKGYSDDSNGKYVLGYDDAAYYDFIYQCSNSVQPNYENFISGVGDGLYDNLGARGQGYIQTGKWYTIIFTCDSKTKVSELYINNRIANSVGGNPNASYNANNDPLYIGRQESPSYPYYANCIIDEIRIYNRYFSSEEENTLYKNLNEKD